MPKSHRGQRRGRSLGGTEAGRGRYGDGNLFVADSGNSTVRKVTPAGVVTTIGGAAGVIGWADGIGSSAHFYCPSGIAVDRAGNLYVADSATSRISKGTPIRP